MPTHVLVTLELSLGGVVEWLCSGEPWLSSQLCHGGCITIRVTYALSLCSWPVKWV